MTARLAAFAGIRQVEASVRADRAAAAASRACARVRRALLALLKRPPQPCEAFALAAQICAALPRLAAAAVADQLAASVRWGHRSSCANLARCLPRRRRAGLKEDLDWDDLFAPWREEPEGGDLLSMLFAAPSAARTNEIVFGSGWMDRLLSGASQGDPQRMAQTLATGLIAGRNPAEIARDILPAVQGVESTARRIARTESLRVAAAVQMDAHAGLGDLVIGYQIHATLDERTRPAHRARDGTVYYVRPEPGQPGLDQMPRPPQEADGSISWNCRCFLTPVLREPGEGRQHAAASAPDPLVYSDWFSKTDERRRRIAVGTRRYSLVKKLTGLDAPGWEHFADLDTGRLQPVDALAAEKPAAREARVTRAAAELARLRGLKRGTSERGHL